MEELKAGNLSFGPYEIDRAKRRLLRNGETLPLNSKTFDLLLFFAENHGSRSNVLDRKS
ncbi:MAG TPA: DNA-binding response regulator, partial [Blastocatellia bacterium]|nr:DNA-binding response regulator [Blastocatellia bacterium]